MAILLVDTVLGIWDEISGRRIQNPIFIKNPICRLPADCPILSPEAQIEGTLELWLCQTQVVLALFNWKQNLLPK